MVKVTGSVLTDEMEILPRANVIEVGGKGIGTSTDEAGIFTLNVDSLNSVVQFSYVGYATQTFTAKELLQKSYIEMIPTFEQLPELVINNNASKKNNTLLWILGIGVLGLIGYQITKKKNYKKVTV